MGTVSRDIRRVALAFGSRLVGLREKPNMMCHLKKRALLGALAATFVAFPIAVIATSALFAGGQARADGTTAHAFSFENIDGGQFDLKDFAGKPVLVVNTASMCGFTYQYEGLQALYDRYKARGLVVLTVPSDDFGGQEYASEEKVKQFCEVNFGLDLPMTNITKVRGRDAHPFYAWAKQDLGPAKAPRWNFHKYLVAPDGRLVGAFSHGTEPEAPALTKAIEAILPGA